MYPEQFNIENDFVRNMFDMEDLIKFSMEHDVQIIRESDWMYACYIDGGSWGTALTPLNALVTGILIFKKHEK